MICALRRLCSALRRPALLLLLAAPAAAQQGGIEVFAGETIFDQGIRLSLSHLYNVRDELRSGTESVADPLDRKLTENRTVLGVDYGATPDLQFSALVPFVHKQLDTNVGSRDVSGLGDIALLAKYRFYQRNGPQRSFNLAIVGGVETPTGESKKTDGAGILPAPLQPGNGAWNPFTALSMTYGFGRARIDSTLFYKMNTEGAADLERGDFVTLDLSGAYRVYHVKYPGPTVGLRAGLQFRHESASELAGTRITNSGSDMLLFKTSVGIHPTPDTDFALGVELPFWQDYDGQQLERGTRLVLKLGIRF